MQLINDSGKHNKFWSYDIDDKNTVTISWGRLGTKGQNRTYKFYSKYDAEKFANDKMIKKRRKGYIEVDDEAFSLKQFQAELIGSGSKIIKISFMRKIQNTRHKPIISAREPHLDKCGYFEPMYEEAALADPTYEPLIYCALMLVGKETICELLIDAEKVYSCDLRLNLNDLIDGKWTPTRSEIQNVREIDSSSDKELQRIKDKAPTLVSVLLRSPNDG